MSVADLLLSALLQISMRITGAPAVVKVNWDGPLAPCIYQHDKKREAGRGVRR